MDNKQLQSVILSEIPISRSMGIQVTECGADAVSLFAPLDANINHKCTAFGGSLYSVLVLCGWGLLYAAVARRGLSGHIVIQESHVDYIKPVEEDIVARCAFESHQQYERFINTYERRGRARIRLVATVDRKGERQVTFNGRYVMHTHTV